MFKNFIPNVLLIKIKSAFQRFSYSTSAARSKKKTQMFEVHSSTLYKYECEKVSFHYLIIRYHIPKESSHKTNNVYVFHPKAMYRLCGYYVNDLGAYN